MKGEYYCYFHHIKHRKARVLIDPEVTRMDLPVIEDRASIFVSLAAVVHRLAENTIDTKRAGQMIYGLQTALQALPPEPAHHAQCHPAPEHTPTVQPAPDYCHSDRRASEACHPERSEEPRCRPDHPNGSNLSANETQDSRRQPETVTAPQRTTEDEQQTTPEKITITKESLMYFLRARHCYHCNHELFPAEELNERPSPGAPSRVVEENEHIKRLSDRYPGECTPALLLDLNDYGKRTDTRSPPNI